MQHIETVTVGSGGAASIEFSAIAADWTDLLVKFSLRTTQTAVSDYITVYFNGSTTGYSYRFVRGNGSNAVSDDVGRLYVNANSATANTFGNGEIYIPNYGSSVAKSFSSDSVAENNGTEGLQVIQANLWSGTAAITSIELDPALGTFVEFSSASLYGITKGSDGTTTVS